MEQIIVNINGEEKVYQIGLDFSKPEPARITDIAAVRQALIEFKQERGGFDTLALTKRAREIAGRFITDGSVTRLARMWRDEVPFVCVRRLKGQYEFLEPGTVPDKGGDDGTL